MAVENLPRTIWWEDDSVRLVDQSRLPLVGDLLVCNLYQGICTAISSMAVRGAPALGVAAALGIALWVRNQSEDYADVQTFLAGLDDVAEEIASTRPTAVNLRWGAERMKAIAHANADMPLPELKDLLVQEAINILEEDEARNRKIGGLGAELLKPESSVLTHCNAGSLATAYFGTALGVIFTAHEQGKIANVWVDETRPVLQGARLTAWELILAGVPCALISDNMAATVMGAGLVDAVIVGADRIAANGDVANKVGTYGLAILAHEHGIPFYVAAPTSTVDLTLADGKGIEIEQRDPREVTGVTVSGNIEPQTPDEAKALEMLTENGPYRMGLQKGHELEIVRKGGAYGFDGWFGIAPPNVPVYNPAFDITPAAYVTSIITEQGIAVPDYAASLPEVCAGSGALHELQE